MTQVAHAGRKHSRIGPSSAKRWIACPASVQRSEGVSNESNSFAQHGTAAHTLAEHVMVTGVDPRTLEGGVIDLQADGASAIRAPGTFNIEPDGWNVFEIDAEMIEAVELYRDTLLPLIEEGDIAEYECRLDMRHVHPDFFGTGDGLIFKRVKRRLILADFKYGYVGVEVHDNDQCMSYGVGALKRFGVENIDEVTLIIVQPRSYHSDGPVRKHTMSVVDLMLFESYLAERAALTDDPNAPAKAGAHCQYCPVAWGCNDLRRYVFNIIGIEPMAKLTDNDLPDVQKMTLDDLGRVRREASIIENWMKRVEEHAHNTAINGKMPTGMKLVATTARRSFTDQAAAIETLETLGFAEEDYMYPPKIRTVKQIEDAIGKKRFEEALGHLVEKKSTGVKLVPVEARGKPVTLDKSGSFGAVEDE